MGRGVILLLDGEYGAACSFDSSMNLGTLVNGAGSLGHSGFSQTFGKARKIRWASGGIVLSKL